MTNHIRQFNEITPEYYNLAGGKASTLAKLTRASFQVPEGFVILTTAFDNEGLKTEAWQEVSDALQMMRSNDPAINFAVRSSAISEDSITASFAGAFETILNQSDDDEIKVAIQTVYESRNSERVNAYTITKQVETKHDMAIIVQKMIPSEISGVLFTADPVSGSFESMTGNYVLGHGEKLVSGESDAEAFMLYRPKGKYEGPETLKTYADQLYKQATAIEILLGSGQDIEWAIAEGRLHILQSRPITTLSPGNINEYDVNYTNMGNEIWINTNISEAIPDVYSPFTWSIGKILDESLNFIPDYYIFSGNIYGRPYMNISRRINVIKSILGPFSKGAQKMIFDLYGELPKGMNIPNHPMGRSETLKMMVPKALSIGKASRNASKTLKPFFNGTPEWHKQMKLKLENAESPEKLLNLWLEELKPYVLKAWLSAGAAAIGIPKITALNKKLTKMVGPEDCSILMSNLRGNQELESLGPVTGISKVLSGEMTNDQYTLKYGHRGAHEYELSLPVDAENPKWIEHQVREYEALDIDVELLLNNQRKKFDDAFVRFIERYPNKIMWLKKQLKDASESAGLRERGRSEFVRVYRLIRLFALRAGQFYSLGDDVFLLYIDEVESMLLSGEFNKEIIPLRHKNYEKYKSLPAFPAVIKGRFNPEAWANDPNRRIDYFEASMPVEDMDETDLFTGHPGASGRVKGLVRVIDRFEDAHHLMAGEILVTSTTNIGWIPIFPKASAIITDIGAPLSHAAIVARELGIPAVVGCGNATIKLKTGDKVKVDGGQGTVEIL